MSGWNVTILPNRDVIEVAGPDAEKFLQGLVTSNVAQLAEETAAYAALLTPQGKMISDFFVVRTPQDSCLIDVPHDRLATLLQRLTMYKLRSDVAISDVSKDYTIAAVWRDGEADDIQPKDKGVIAVRDPRRPEMGFRLLMTLNTDWVTGELSATPASKTLFDAHRVAVGVPESGLDFAFANDFPHDANLDQLSGVDFEKGCYVGQEVVSRMKHRGTARRRIVRVKATTALPETGTPIKAGSATIGTLGTVSGQAGLAMLRLDRVQEALNDGKSILAGEVKIDVEIPSWATFKLSDFAPARGNDTAPAAEQS